MSSFGPTTTLNTLSAKTLTAPGNLVINPTGSIDFNNKGVINFQYPPFVQSSIGSSVLTLQSTAVSGANPTKTFYQNKTLTTDATPTALHSFVIPANTSTAIKMQIIANRTGIGASEGALFDYTILYRNISGDATIVGSFPVTLMSAGLTWSVAFSTALDTVTINVTGAVGHNVTWILNMDMMPSST
nr:hypothetical protein K-LCC10_0468 [Kaumoebavirus]